MPNSAEPNNLLGVMCLPLAPLDDLPPATQGRRSVASVIRFCRGCFAEMNTCEHVFRGAVPGTYAVRKSLAASPTAKSVTAFLGSRRLAPGGSVMRMQHALFH
jgi:hypothetical protein